MAEQKKKGLSRLNKAILFLITSAFFFALMNMFVRLSGDVPTIQKTFFRNFFALFIASGAMIKNRCSIIPPKGARFDLFMRAACGYAGVVLNFYAIDRLSISDASLLNKMSPFFVIVFSAMFLRERTNLVQTLGVIVAFAGSLLIIKPSLANLELVPSLLGFLGGMGAGAAYTAVRWLGIRGEKEPYIVFFFSGFSCLVTLPFLLFDFHVMTWQQWLVLLGAGLAAAGGQFSITAAYKFAPAKEISVYDYSQIIFSALLGFILFSQLPDIWSFIGYVIICGVGVAMFFYNNRKDK